MTVLRPSLPPVSWTTTRIVSFDPAEPVTGAASAVLPRNGGTVAPKPRRVDVARKSRRVVMGRTPEEPNPPAPFPKREGGERGPLRIPTLPASGRGRGRG